MANTVHGPYTPTSWISGSTALSTPNLNHLESQDGVALASFNPDLIGSGFVYNGVTCAKDGTIANQLDVALGEAYLKQSDGTLARCDVAATTFTTVTISTTYHLYLQPDGSWYWNTANSPATNSLAICSATTDGSGNILVVTDLRPLTIAMLPNAVGSVSFPAGIVFTGGLSVPGALSVAGALTSLGGQASAGSFGAPVIVAQAINTHVTATTLQTILNATAPATGVYSLSAMVSVQNAGTRTITLSPVYTDANTNALAGGYFFYPGGLASPILLNGWTGASANQSIPTMPQTFYAKTGTAIQLVYQDSTGTPNDFVTGILTRLA